MLLTDREHDGSRAKDESGACYLVDGELGDDPKTLGNSNHGTRTDQLIVLCVSKQPASLSTGPPPAIAEIPQDERG